MEATAQLVAVCDGCGARYRVASQHAGKRLKCRKCDLIISVPLEGAEADAALHAHRPARTAPVVAPMPRHAVGSIRERAQQKHGESHVGPMHYVVVAAVVLVVGLYMLFGR